MKQAAWLLFLGALFFYPQLNETYAEDKGGARTFENGVQELVTYYETTFSKTSSTLPGSFPEFFEDKIGHAPSNEDRIIEDLPKNEDPQVQEFLYNFFASRIQGDFHVAYVSQLKLFSNFVKHADDFYRAKIARTFLNVSPERFVNWFYRGAMVIGMFSAVALTADRIFNGGEGWQQTNPILRVGMAGTAMLFAYVFAKILWSKKDKRPFLPSEVDSIHYGRFRQLFAKAIVIENRYKRGLYLERKVEDLISMKALARACEGEPNVITQ
jgi:hypothetical protein